MTTTLATMEGSVDLVVLPVTFGLRAGTMRLAEGHLRYTLRRRGRVVLDAPLDELHSFARSSWGTGFHLWHGAVRHRFVVYHPAVPVELGPGPVADLAEDLGQLAQGLAAHAFSRAEVDRWADALVPVIAPGAPPGIRVRPPFTPAGFLAAALGFAVAGALVVMAVVTAVVLATG